MKNKIFSVIAIICFVVFGFTSNVLAAINTEADLKFKIDQLEQLCEYDFSSLVNKNELIGFRLDDYNMSTLLYINSIMVTTSNLKNLERQIELIKNSMDISGTEKDMQINKLYRDAETALYDLDAKTINYLMNAKNSMPTITYNKFVSTFQSFYNSLYLTGQYMSVK